MRKVGMLFQNAALFDSLPVWENVAFGLIQAQGLPRREARGVAIEILAQVGLDAESADLYPAALSGGMRKRVGLARAIATRPEIILFDEPTTGLDPIMADVINDLIVACTRELGATTLTITHDMTSARKIADRIAMIHDGTIIWQGPAAEIDSSGNAHVQQFINGRGGRADPARGRPCRGRLSGPCRRQRGLGRRTWRGRRSAMYAAPAAPCGRAGPAVAMPAAPGTAFPRRRPALRRHAVSETPRAGSSISCRSTGRAACSPGERAASARSTGLWAAASCRDRWSCSRAIPASASPPCCCRRPPLWPGAEDRLSTSRARKGLSRFACAPPGSVSRARPIGLAAAIDVRDIVTSLEDDTPPDMVVIDSIQTMYLDTLDSAPGTVAQVRGAAQELIRLAKRTGTVLVLVGHVTKEGQIAGPRVLEHMVDCVLYFEGERGHQFRIVRAIKNRFGPTDEIGVFEMTDRGLMEIPNPSSLFVDPERGPVPGAAVFAGVEGSRPVLVEIQALVAPGPAGSPRRTVVGWDAGRLAMVLAVLEARAGLRLSVCDVYLNVAGGLRITEPAADLAVAAALASSLAGRALDQGAVIFGEVGLGGEVRPVSQGEARLKEAAKLGFSHALAPVPDRTRGEAEGPGIAVTRLTHVRDLVALFPPAAGAGL